MSHAAHGTQLSFSIVIPNQPCRIHTACHTAMSRRHTTVLQEPCSTQCHQGPPPYYVPGIEHVRIYLVYILSGVHLKLFLTCLTLNTFPMRSIRSPLTTTTVSPLENSGICAPRRIFIFGLDIGLDFRIRFPYTVSVVHSVRFWLSFSVSVTVSILVSFFIRFGVFGRRFRFRFRSGRFGLVWFRVGSISVPIGHVKQPPRGESSGRHRHEQMQTRDIRCKHTKQEPRDTRNEERRTRQEARGKRQDTRDIRRETRGTGG